MDVKDTIDGRDTQEASGDQHQKEKTMAMIKTQICYDFTKGMCVRGSQCRYSHDIEHIAKVNQNTNRGICFEHLKGSCLRGKLCKFHHDLYKVTENPTRRIDNGSRICFDFVKGACARGESCPYSH